MSAKPVQTQVEHACTTPWDGEDAELENVVPGSNLDVRMQRKIKRRFLVSGSGNHRICGYLRSLDAVKREKRRHLTTYFYMIHPFSDVRKYWEMVMLVAIFVSLIVAPVITAWPESSHSTWSMLVLLTDILCLVDVGLNFTTGRPMQDIRWVDMRPKAVAWAYLRGQFIFDMLGAVPADAIDILIGTIHGEKLTPWEPLRALKLLRFVRFITYYRNLLQVYNVSFLKERCMMLAISVLTVLHVSACTQFYITIWSAENTGRPVVLKSWLEQLKIKELCVLDQYVRSLFRSASILFGVCVFFNHESVAEQNIHLILIVFGQILLYVLIANVILITKIQHASVAKYQHMTRQLKHFFIDQKLSPYLQDKVLAYYDFRFQKSYYVESEIMNTLSEQIKKDVLHHNCLHLVDNVSFFRVLPGALKTRLVSRMRSMYCLVDDVIVRADEPGVTMYFVKSGTLAVYSSSGKEIRHFEDGQHFGELSLVLENQVTRVARIAAIENCELYSLDRIAFIDAMSPYPEVLAKLRRIAKQRLEKTKGLLGDDVIEGV